MMNEEEQKYWDERLKVNTDALKDSAIFLELWSKGIQKDPLACMQLGLCMMLDKPIYILAEEGTEIPKNMLLVAKGIKYYEPGKINEAANEVARWHKESQMK